MPDMNKIEPIEKNVEKAIKFEVIMEEQHPNKMNSQKASQGHVSPTKREKENPSTTFTETVQLCCLTMTAGPGTTFGDYKIPEGAKCSVCGSGLKKGRM